MPHRQHASRAETKAHHKIIFTGPVGAGKTTAIAALSDFPPVQTDEIASDMTQGRKVHTTVALDYGAFSLADGQKIHLYGTPGQERFNFMWDILTQGGLGLILLLDNSRADPFRDLRFFLGAFKEFIARTQAVIGITHLDDKPQPAIPDYRDELQRLGYAGMPVLATDPRRNADVAELLRNLLYRLDPDLNKEHA
jgi:signal recognition particle receptor subunit beta